MSQADWGRIQGTYGVGVVRYLKHCNVSPNIGESGVYEIPNMHILKECSKRSINAHQKLEIKRRNLKPKITPTYETKISKECYDMPDNFKRVVNIDTRKYQSNKRQVDDRRKSPSFSGNLTICFEEIYKVPLRATGLSISKYACRKKACSLEELFEHMMQKKIGRTKAIDYQDCLEEIVIVLREFQKKHENFRYFALLETILNERSSANKHTPQVSLQELQKYFYIIFANVIPRSLFGNNKNIKKLRAGLKQYFLAPLNEVISLKAQCLSMDISCITWLRSIKHEETRWLILAKVVKWLFEEFIAPILKMVFKIRKQLHSEEKIFLSAKRWKCWQYNYIKKQRKKKTIIQRCLSSRKQKVVSPGKMRLFPKKNGVRCIYQLRVNSSAASEMAMVKVFLQQLFHQNYDLVNTKTLYTEWLKYTKRSRKNGDRTVYLVSSDIVDAYGSVIQSKLYDIIHCLINEIPHETLPLEWLAILKPNKTWKKNSIEYKAWFSYCTTRPQIRAGSMVTLATDADHKKSWISKQRISSLLKSYIFQQTFWLKGKQYIQKKGIVQGSPLSPILAEIYYAHMSNQEFGIFMKSGTLARFVDDFLYVTFDERSAKHYLKKIKQGIPGYNCRFNTSKTQTNVESTYFTTSASVTYLGYRIDSKSLEFNPIYKESSCRYLKTMQRIYYKNEIPTFVNRLMNFSSLKLCPMVLSSNINSRETLLSTAKSAGYAMASRCTVLISRVFDNLEHHIPQIWDEIRYAVKILASMFIRHIYQYRKEDRDAFIRSIKISIWESFYRVFARRNKLRRYFGADIKRMVKNRKVF